MENKTGNARMLLFLISAALVVVLAISLLAYFSTKSADRTGIVLPSASAGSHDDPGKVMAEGFVSVTPENASAVVRTLNRPDSYHQMLYKQIVSDDATGIFSVHIWFNRGICKLILSESGQTRHILTNGKQIYLWYEDDPLRIEMTDLPEYFSMDDLSGIPTYETILSMDAEQIQYADYRDLSEQAGTPCLFVSSSDSDGSLLNMWVDLSSGLLCKAEHVQDGKLVYSFHQSDLVVLDPSDAMLNSQLLLPDGSAPFAIAS